MQHQKIHNFEWIESDWLSWIHAHGTRMHTGHWESLASPGNPTLANRQRMATRCGKLFKALNQSCWKSFIWTDLGKEQKKWQRKKLETRGHDSFCRLEPEQIWTENRERKSCQVQVLHCHNSFDHKAGNQLENWQLILLMTTEVYTKPSHLTSGQGRQGGVKGPAHGIVHPHRIRIHQRKQGAVKHQRQLMKKAWLTFGWYH